MNGDQQVDMLNAELKLVMGQLGDSKVEGEAKDLLMDRLKELTDKIVSISKRGDAPVYIINLLENRHIIARSYASFWIRGKTEGEEYAVNEITGKGGSIDTGRGGEPNTQDRGWRVKLDRLYWPAALIAKDICREINNDLPALQVSPGVTSKIVKSRGCFVSENRVPGREVYSSEMSKLKYYAAALVAEGNMIWRKTKDYRMVSDLNRWGVDFLGLSTEWHESLNAIMGGNTPESILSGAEKRSRRTA